MTTPRPIRCIFGLGNPGPDYLQTYHNAGFLAVEYLADKYSGPKPDFRKNSAGKFEYLRTPDFILARSGLFMNESGLAVKRALKHFRLAPAQLLVVHDDSDIVLGEARLVFGRGSAGHHGVDSVVAHLGTKDFWRLRLGIRHGTGPAENFVLRPISHANLEKIYRVAGTFSENLTKNAKPISAGRISVKGKSID